MIDRFPKCLQTCLNCSHAVIYEEYSETSSDIVFGGCWKVKGVRKPVDRANCQRFKENPERVKRSFWKKWEGHTYIAYKENPFRYEQEERINYDTFRVANDLLPAEHALNIEGDEDIEKDEPPLRDPRIIAAVHEELPARPGQIKECEQIDKKSVTRVTETELPAPVHEPTARPVYIDELPYRTEVPKHIDELPDLSKVSEKSDPCKPDPVLRTPRTRSLILQALANNISRLKDIAQFSDVDTSTAHYHLRNLIREGRVTKVSWGEYIFSDDQPINGKFLKSDGRTFEKFLRNFSQSCTEITGSTGLHPVEKNILMDILSKENRYEHFSERELSRKSNVSRYAVKKYTQKLEKKQLIKVKREGKQLVFVPTDIAINAVKEFFQSEKTGSNFDSSSSKIQPIIQPITDSKSEPITETNNGPQYEPELLENTGETSNIYNPSDTFETFDDYIAWQQKNAHRLIIQFKLLRCDHSRLKRTGWIFGQKSIHRHFTEAYIFKSKDPAGQIINVLPKEPFIFTSPFEFEDKITEFVNEIIDRLREYGIVIDLSEPAEIKLEHVALENDVFARKAIKKGLLYFRSKTVTVDSTGEYIEYVIGIDKSKKIHLEVEGVEAHHFTEEYEAFIDDVVTKKINRRELKELPRKMEVLKAQITEEFTHIQDRLNSSIQGIENTQHILHENQLQFSQNLVSHVEMVSKIAEAADSVNKAADTIREAAESLRESLQIFKVGIESLAIHRMV